MKISIVVAVSDNGVIGKEGKIPWYIPEDLKHFRRLTLGHHVLMGRKTFESIGKPLPERTNLVLTKIPSYKAEGAYVFDTIEGAVKFAEENGEKELMVIGGAEVYREMLPVTETIYMTRVCGIWEGETFFPKFDLRIWRETEREVSSSNVPFSIRKLERVG